MPKAIPDHIKKFEALKKKYNRLVNTLDVEHSAAYLKGAATITGKDGQVDYELLEDEKAQEKFADAVTGHYLEKANKYFGSNVKGGDDFQADMLLNAFAGTTKNELYRTIKKSGKNYTLDQHEKIKGRLIKKVTESVRPTVTAQIKDEHVPDYIKYMGLEGLVNVDAVRPEDIDQIHDQYDATGVVTEKQIREMYGTKPIVLKKGRGKIIKYEPQYDAAEAKKAA
jgi:hypothetical protein